MTIGASLTSRYPIPATTHRVEQEILRSRFIATVGQAPTVAAARQLVEQVRTEFADASHNCWAYVVGAPGSTGQNGFSDDGEPHGTAGRPMLTVLLHSGLGDICAVVTRYFGGALLGKGGLVKAYSGGVQLALASAPTGERIPKIELLLVIEYEAVTPLQRLLPRFEAEVLAQEFAADVTYRLSLPVDQQATFVDQVTELTHGQALLEFLAPSSPT
jgi:uncharacterized YigZ family protein